MKIPEKNCQGGSLIEGLLSLLIVSAGLISIVILLIISIREVGNAKNRSLASLLANGLISEMWVDDRSLSGLKKNYGDENAGKYKKWREIVEEKLPGVSKIENKPEITISENRNVTVKIKWQSPGEKNSHNLIIATVITD